MIKAEDLRIGDLVRYGEQVITIHAVYYKCIDDFVIGEETFCISCKELIPIPLTPEILEKNGFEVVYPEKCYNKFISSPGSGLIRFLSIENWQTEWKVFLKYTNRADYVLLRFAKYVHELQHILWALGEGTNLKV